MSKPLPGRAPANLPGSRGPAAATYPPHIHPGWQFAVSSGILGWILDAYYFFVLVFLVDVLAGKFHVSKAAIVWSITITLATRPLGALILGSMADKFGRRRPLIACVLFFSIVSAFTPFAPNYTAFLLLRALYGVGMGGYWGIGASLVMESSPVRWRGLFSGILQAGYSLGYLLAAVAIPLVASEDSSSPHWSRFSPCSRRNRRPGKTAAPEASCRWPTCCCGTKKILPTWSCSCPR
jgi:MFS family permease